MILGLIPSSVCTLQSLTDKLQYSKQIHSQNCKNNIAVIYITVYRESLYNVGVTQNPILLIQEIPTLRENFLKWVMMALLWKLVRFKKKKTGDLRSKSFRAFCST